MRPFAAASFLFAASLATAHRADASFATAGVLGLGTRAIGMGGAFTAIADDASAVYWNPAGLGFLMRYEATMLYGLHLEGRERQFSPAFAGPLYDEGGFAISLDRLLIPGRDQAKSIENIFQVQYATPPLWNIALGAGLRGYYGTYPWFSGGTTEAQGWAGDFGLLWKQPFRWAMGEEFSVGVAYTNANAHILWPDLGTVEALNPQLAIAVGYMPDLKTVLDVEYALHKDTNLSTDKKGRLRAGLERWLFGDHVGLRIGLQKFKTQPPNWSGGFSLRILAAQLDYAFMRPLPHLGASHRIQFTVKFGGPPRVQVNGYPNPFYDRCQFDLRPDFKRLVTDWTLTVFTASGEPVKSFQGRGATPKRVRWDAKNDAGEYVDDGRYYYSLNCLYRTGISAQSGKQSILVDRNGPYVRTGADMLTLVPDAKKGGTELKKPITFRMQANSISGVRGWSLEVYSEKTGKVFKTFNGDGAPPAVQVWDGKGDDGRLVDPGGLYRFLFKARNNASTVSEKGQLITDGHMSVTPKELLKVRPRRIPPPKLVQLMAKGLVFQLTSNECRFDTGKADLKSEYLPSMDRVIEVLKEYPELKISIEGHTDNQPIHSDEFPSNMELSQARARAVMEYLIKQGVAPERMTYVGFGDTKPLMANTTDEWRAKNRRIDVVILVDQGEEEVEE